MPTDVLDRLLITLAVRLHAFAYCEIERGWRLTFNPMDMITIHYVLAGSGVLQTDTGASVSFRADNIVIVPARVSQSLGEVGASAGVAAGEEHATLVDDGLVKFTAGDGSRDILIICGAISATYGGALGLFDRLSEPLVEDLSSSKIVRQLFKLLVEELLRPTVGTQVLTESLMKHFLVLVLRQHVIRRGDASPFFTALKDWHLAQAVTAVLERPAAAHTVKSLAAIAGISRSSFAERFTRAYGLSPLDFVRRVRLRHAANLLSTTALPVKVIASSSGYVSRSYFSRAFRAAYGVDPKTFRAFRSSVEQESSPILDPSSVADADKLPT